MQPEPTAEYRTRVRITEVEAWPALEITPESYYREVFGDEPIPADIAASIVSVPDRLLKAYDALGTARAEIHRAIMEHATREIALRDLARASRDPEGEAELRHGGGPDAITTCRFESREISPGCHVAWCTTHHCAHDSNGST